MNDGAPMGESERESVVLLHGLGPTAFAMKGLEGFLWSQGYRVINQGYDSRNQSIPELSRQLFRDLSPRLGRAGQVHFVTHSMGGILLRYGLQHWQLPDSALGRAVMLAPPSQGSEVVDSLRRLSLVTRVMGPAFLQLGTGADSLPLLLLEQEQQQLPLEVGIIAGRRSYEPWFNPLFGGSNDGKVSVARSRHPGMRDFRVLDVGHTFIMNNRKVRQHILHFLQHGCFV